MKTSNLARRLEEFAATMESLHLTPPPATRLLARQEGGAGSEAPARPRRGARPRGIQIRDDGLRAFRVF